LESAIDFGAEGAYPASTSGKPWARDGDGGDLLLALVREIGAGNPPAAAIADFARLPFTSLTCILTVVCDLGHRRCEAMHQAPGQRRFAAVLAVGRGRRAPATPLDAL
jgi:hypothetical protein